MLGFDEIVELIIFNMLNKARNILSNNKIVRTGLKLIRFRQKLIDLGDGNIL